MSSYKIVASPRHSIEPSLSFYFEAMPTHDELLGIYSKCGGIWFVDLKAYKHDKSTAKYVSISLKEFNLQ